MTYKQRAVRPLVDRLADKVATDDNGCLIWLGAKEKGGYGHIARGRSGAGMVKTHRVMYEHVKGPIPDGLHIDHLCRVTACCLPDHLEAVPQRINNERRTAAIVQCPQGHAYDEANTGYVRTASGGTARRCRACDRQRRAAWRARQAAVRTSRERVPA